MQLALARVYDFAIMTRQLKKQAGETKVKPPMTSVEPPLPPNEHAPSDPQPVTTRDDPRPAKVKLQLPGIGHIEGWGWGVLAAVAVAVILGVAYVATRPNNTQDQKTRDGGNNIGRDLNGTLQQNSPNATSQQSSIQNNVGPAFQNSQVNGNVVTNIGNPSKAQQDSGPLLKQIDDLLKVGQGRSIGMVSKSVLDSLVDRSAGFKGILDLKQEPEYGEVSKLLRDVRSASKDAEDKLLTTTFWTTKAKTLADSLQNDPHARTLPLLQWLVTDAALAAKAGQPLAVAAANFRPAYEDALQRASQNENMQKGVRIATSTFGTDPSAENILIQQLMAGSSSRKMDRDIKKIQRLSAPLRASYLCVLTRRLTTTNVYAEGVQILTDVSRTFNRETDSAAWRDICGNVAASWVWLGDEAQAKNWLKRSGADHIVSNVPMGLADLDTLLKSEQKNGPFVMQGAFTQEEFDQNRLDEEVTESLLKQGKYEPDRFLPGPAFRRYWQRRILELAIAHGGTAEAVQLVERQLAKDDKSAGRLIAPLLDLTSRYDGSPFRSQSIAGIIDRVIELRGSVQQLPDDRLATWHHVLLRCRLPRDEQLGVERKRRKELNEQHVQPPTKLEEELFGPDNRIVRLDFDDVAVARAVGLWRVRAWQDLDDLLRKQASDVTVFVAYLSIARDVAFGIAD